MENFIVRIFGRGGEMFLRLALFFGLVSSAVEFNRPRVTSAVNSVSIE